MSVKKQASAASVDEEKRSIAICIDQSEYADYAFEWYCKYLHAPANNVVCIHVAVDFDIAKAQKELAKGGQLKQDLERQYSRITDLENRFSQKMHSKGIRGAVLSVPSKNAGQTILDTAKEEGAFAILMGTRGRSKIKKAFLGSVSDYVMHNAEIPVVVVRRKEGAV